MLSVGYTMGSYTESQFMKGDTMVPIEKTKSRFEELMYYFGFPTACIVFALLATMSTPAGLTYSGKMALAVFTCALILWVSESVLPT